MTTQIEGYRAEILRQNKDSGKDPYELLLARMVRSAEKHLERNITGLKIQAMPLPEAMERLAKAAGLSVICYPWGEHGRFKLSSDVRVTLDATKPMTLAAALDRITKDVFGEAAEDKADKPKDDKEKGDKPTPPMLKWAMCAGMPRVLFPRAGQIEIFPVSVGGTGANTRAELMDDDILGSSQTGPRGGRRLVDIVFRAQEFLPAGKRSPGGFEAGMDGPRMYVGGMRRGRLLWRLAKASPARRPAAITPELRKQIVDDLRIQEAFGAMAKLSETLLADARKKGLTAVAGQRKKETVDTDLFARKVRFSQREQMQRVLMYRDYMMRQSGMSRPFQWYAAFFQTFLLPPTQFVWTTMAQPVTGVDLPPAEGPAEAFMKVAFSLVPADVEKPFADPKPAVARFPVPSKRQVLLMQRIGYEPGLISEFENTESARIAKDWVARRRWLALQEWFSLKRIKGRTAFQPRRR